MLERRGVVVGAAVTEDFLPGFRSSTARHTVGVLYPRVTREVRLAGRCLNVVERPLSTSVSRPDGSFLKFGSGCAATQAKLAKFSAVNAQRLPHYFAQHDRFAADLRHWVCRAAPSVCGPSVAQGWRDPAAAARLRWR